LAIPTGSTATIVPTHFEDPVRLEAFRKTDLFADAFVADQSSGTQADIPTTVKAAFDTVTGTLFFADPVDAGPLCAPVGTDRFIGYDHSLAAKGPVVRDHLEAFSRVRQTRQLPAFLGGQTTDNDRAGMDRTDGLTSQGIARVDSFAHVIRLYANQRVVQDGALHAGVGSAHIAIVGGQ
jgi:hypothetical protein